MVHTSSWRFVVIVAFVLIQEYTCFPSIKTSSVYERPTNSRNVSPTSASDSGCRSLVNSKRRRRSSASYSLSSSTNEIPSFDRWSLPIDSFPVKSVASLLLIAFAMLGSPESSRSFDTSMFFRTSDHNYWTSGPTSITTLITTLESSAVQPDSLGVTDSTIIKSAQNPSNPPPDFSQKTSSRTFVKNTQLDEVLKGKQIVDENSYKQSQPNQKDDYNNPLPNNYAQTDSKTSDAINTKVIKQSKGNETRDKKNYDKKQQSRKAGSARQSPETQLKLPDTTNVKKGQSKSISSAPQKQPQLKNKPKPTPLNDLQRAKKSSKTELQPIDIKKVAEQNTVDIELICKEDDERPIRLLSQSAVIKVDRDTFQKIKVYQPALLKWLPPSLQPRFQSMQVLKSIPNDQLFFASVVAGSLTEIIRTTISYPLGTVKARVQARTLRSTNRKRPLLRKLRVTWLTFLYETKRGDWYAGIVPSLLITIPASGVYSGVKDVSKRLLTMAVPMQSFSYFFHGDVATASYYGSLLTNLLAAFVADLASVAIRTPADVLALRLQVFGKTNVKSDLSDWAKDSVALLPSMLICDLPFSLMRQSRLPAKIWDNTKLKPSQLPASVRS